MVVSGLSLRRTQALAAAVATPMEHTSPTSTMSAHTLGDSWPEVGVEVGVPAASRGAATGNVRY